MVTTLPAPPPGTDPGHLPALDGLRGLAIVLVLLHNLDVLEISAGSGLLGRLVKELMFLGWIGVQLFFVLSGYLITRGLLARSAGPGWYGRFLVRRSLRILPLYLVSLLLFTLLLPGLLPQWAGPLQRGDGWLWVFVANWTGPIGWGGQDRLPHFWSLAVEEQFYLLWPLLLHRRPPWQVVALCAGLIVLGPPLRAALLAGGTSPEAVYAFTISRMDALATGAALAAWQALQGARRRPCGPLPRVDPGHPEQALKSAGLVWLAGLSLLLAAGVVSHGFQRTSGPSQVWGYSLLSLGFVLLLWTAVRPRSPIGLKALSRSPLALLLHWPYVGLRLWQRLLRLDALRQLGRYSFAIYVLHKPVHDLIGLPLLEAWLPQARGHTGLSVLYIGLVGALVVALAWVSWHCLEQPMLTLKERLTTPARGAAPAARA
ncbi:peptidoglycan/LPS O-acetylase OafA/YrhL [Sphaerotilus hippei]|uniref:Peptidoglycan/LPS O-acetylase OafA/YrhL n=1 Tax=Sphaerotilus hippei TaxID=744406 RepID=A0A318H0G7_9BURK|nr:acyltransferase [Sphaerotilus hippei]PXW96221.1 peptidoglycan/LPS O-acetylase OafA/YrhL [Sphaerotilus hippei]